MNVLIKEYFIELIFYVMTRFFKNVEILVVSIVLLLISCNTFKTSSTTQSKRNYNCKL